MSQKQKLVVLVLGFILGYNWKWIERVIYWIIILVLLATIHSRYF